MKKVILLNGAIRDTEEFSLIIDCILHKVSKYSAQVDVVVATWHEDITARQPFFNWLVMEGIKVVGVASINEGGPANVFRQWRTLEAGLSIVPDDAIVLKGRTDKFLLRKDVIDAFLSPTADAALAQLAVAGKLAVEHVSLSLPYMAKDMVYLGSPKAMRGMLHYSVRTQYCADHIFNGIGPECFLWLEYSRNSSFVMTLIQRLDLRMLSNNVLVNGTVDRFDWSTLHPVIAALYQEWIKTFDDNFLFLSDVLDCNPVPSWPIDEGSWRYQIGDRKEYENLRHAIAGLSASTEVNPEGLPFLNSTMEYVGSDEPAEKPSLPFVDMLDEIRNNDDRRYSDIVVLRQIVIERELASATPDKAALRSAMHWNIRQRDRSTLKQCYDWIMAKAPQCVYLSEPDQVFVVERMVDLYTFSSDRDGIAKAIEQMPHLFAKSPALRIRMAEHHFTLQNRWKALYWFWQSYRENQTGLGVNHGLGCTLLDLGYPSLALKYLRRAHAASPQDQTAAFTLIRALSATSRRKEGISMLPMLTGNLRVEAERILSV